MITATSFTGYGYWLEHGATSLWEWFRDLNESFEGSKNHHFFGDISSLFIQEFAGLKPNPRMEDVDEFEISPRIPTVLRFAEARYEGRRGQIRTRWEKTEKGIQLTVEAPEGVRVTIVPPEWDHHQSVGDSETILFEEERKITRVFKIQ